MLWSARVAKANATTGRLEVRCGRNIAEILDMSVSEAKDLFAKHPAILAKLETLDAVGLGYLKLGQPANTLSGGESQRLKLSLELSKRQTGPPFTYWTNPRPACIGSTFSASWICFSS